MTRVNLRNSTGEVLDSLLAYNEETAAANLATYLTTGFWLLSAGDSITIEEE